MPRPRNVTLAQVLTVAQMRGAEAALIEAGASVDALMEQAGTGAGEWVRRLAAGRPVTVLCGPGNNGGYGYVIARWLAGHGNPVRVVAPLEPATPACRNARDRCPGEIFGTQDAAEGEVLVDCLFGSGLTRPLGPVLAGLLAGLAARHRLTVAVDLPSEIESDSGAVLDSGLPACAVTLALGAWKHAHFAMPGAARMGALRLVDIGIGAVHGAARMLERPALAPPAADAHKYTRGLLAIVAGAMPGATLLAAEAALRAGAGYVTLVAEARPEGVPPELVCQLAPDLAPLADARVRAVLVGPGLGRDVIAAGRLAGTLARSRPCVLDADALVLLGRDMALPAAAVLTPHEGELAALERRFGLDGRGPRHVRATALARASGAVVLAKGPDSVIAAPSGDVMVAPRASAWLSVAGTGDVLAGLVASRLAVHGDPFRAAGEGLWLHGAAARHCGPGLTAGALARAVPAALAECLA